MKNKTPPFLVKVEAASGDKLRLSRYQGSQRDQVAEMTIFHDTTVQNIHETIEDFRKHGIPDEDEVA